LKRSEGGSEAAAAEWGEPDPNSERAEGGGPSGDKPGTPEYKFGGYKYGSIGGCSGGPNEIFGLG